jgi:hypothetical protein
MPTGIAASLVPLLQRHRRHRYSYLLGAQLFLILIFPFATGEDMRPGWFGILTIFVMATGLFAIVEERWLTVVGLTLGVTSMSIELAAAIRGQGPSMPDIVGLTAFFGFLSAVLIRSVVKDAQVNTETLIGAMAGYLLLGITWGAAYAMTEMVWPGTFHYSGAIRPVAWQDFTFFSFVTLTTVGYGDIIPVGAHGKSLVVLEAVAGVLYPAILVARLISMHGNKHSSFQ